jgi:flagellar basal-body rod protein FlgC
MITNVSSNLSALRAYGTKMGVHADNVANVNTDGYKKNRALLKEGPNQSVGVDIQKMDTPGAVYERYEGHESVEKETSNVDLAEEFTGMMTTQHAYSANLKVVKTQDEILGSLLDIMG